jgi:hypothetical protein
MKSTNAAAATPETTADHSVSLERIELNIIEYVPGAAARMDQWPFSSGVDLVAKTLYVDLDQV